jgi:hypothetical protein
MALAAYFLFVYPERCMVPVARAVRTATDVNALDSAIREYLNSIGNLPQTLGDLAPKFIRTLPQDAWGHDYRLEHNGERFEVFSYGADGVKGGGGSAADRFPGAATYDIVASIRGTFSCN